MRISDWSSDVCSSDLLLHKLRAREIERHLRPRHVRDEEVCAAHSETLAGDEPRHRRHRRARNMLRQVGHDPRADHPAVPDAGDGQGRSEEHTSELQSLMRISYAVFCLKKKIRTVQI